MSFISQLFSFKGRLSRSSFWFILLINIGALFLIMFLFILLWFFFLGELVGNYMYNHSYSRIESFPFGVQEVLFFLFLLPLLIIWVATLTKRFHDIGKSGWWSTPFVLLSLIVLLMYNAWMYIILVPFALVSMWLLIELAFLDGDKYSNLYGDRPVSVYPLIKSFFKN